MLASYLYVSIQTWKYIFKHHLTRLLSLKTRVKTEKMAQSILLEYCQSWKYSTITRLSIFRVSTTLAILHFTSKRNGHIN